MSSNWNCPRCQMLHEAGDTFCVNCGITPRGFNYRDEYIKLVASMHAVVYLRAKGEPVPNNLYVPYFDEIPDDCKQEVKDRRKAHHNI